jgi:hypothetical protein
VPDDQFREQMVGRSVPPEAADRQLGIFDASRAGELAALDQSMAPSSVASPPP